MGLIDDFNVKMRVKGSPISTRKTYTHWVERFIRHCRQPDGSWRHPTDLEKIDIEGWLTEMALQLNVSPSTQNIALQSMMGHADIRTTQIYLHCDANTGVLNKTPFAKLLANPGLVQAQLPTNSNAQFLNLRRFTGTDN